MSTRILTPEWDHFLDQLSREPNVGKAARAAGLKPSACYAHRERSPDFRRAWDEAIAEAVDRIEEEIHRRAIHGVDKALYYQGMKYGSERVYSDSLAALYVKRWIPEYRDRSTVDMNAKVVHAPMTDAEREQAVGEFFAKAYTRMAAAGHETEGERIGPFDTPDEFMKDLGSSPVPEDFDLG